MSSAHGDKIKLRNHLRRSLLARMEERKRILAQRERDPSSVDAHALTDLSTQELSTVTALRAAGGSEKDLRLEVEV
jgi:hypothetical protein